MSYQDQSGGGYPPPHENNGYPPREQRESQYPPPPGEEDERARAAYHQRAVSNSSGVTLPPISPYEQQYASQPNGYTPAYQQGPYRPPPPPAAYPNDRGYQQDYGRGGPQHMAFSQSAPRQRTAIACRYCRRRKIRCSGFDQNPEGRCSNCQRFQQECIFTPVSSQAQAFVPAHTVFPSMRNMAIGPDGRPHPVYPPGQLFGAHGQPLGSVPSQPQSQPSPYEYPAPSPTGSYSSADPVQSSRSQDTGYNSGDRGQSSRSQEPAGYNTAERGSPPYSKDPTRKRPQQDGHPSILPPPMPNQAPYARSESANRRQAIEEDLRLPPVTPTGGQTASNYSPGSSASSHSNLQPPGGLPSMSRTPPPRTSPGEGRADPMSLGNIMERRPDTEIDRSMLGRLDRRG
ncbi:Uncharacterized protein BP5553_00972 [Venustampulla echinocandica]|uniref:Zn(2)-C6 fungal-type domain-containing protein n=1 Tax=Venustampulla echinocandica TaxID=2656787 RepID=A0A370TZN7_9HELO|nr:Uncharacterized protein BP5553_00972 [Venustampulla echinocandica]RDL40993.1 Uncharacterized protein BP5553_00972 [Venustampulla echinocandica]